MRDALEVPLARYAASGAPLVLGTDGYGIYHGDTLAQLRAAQLTGLQDVDVVRRTEAVILAARADADRRLVATPFAVPATLPAGRHYTAELASRRRAEAAADVAALRDAIAARQVPVVEPTSLPAQLAGRRVVSIAGAWRRAWAALDGEVQARIAGVVDGRDIDLPS